MRSVLKRVKNQFFRFYFWVMVDFVLKIHRKWTIEYKNDHIKTNRGGGGVCLCISLFETGPTIFFLSQIEWDSEPDSEMLTSTSWEPPGIEGTIQNGLVLGTNSSKIYFLYTFRTIPTKKSEFFFSYIFSLGIMWKYETFFFLEIFMINDMQAPSSWIVTKISLRVKSSENIRITKMSI